MNAIQLVEVSARDGLQGEKHAASLSAQTKAHYIEMLAACGLRRIEAGSFVRASTIPAMANSEDVAALLKPVQARYPDAVFSYLVPNLKGLERAAAVGAREVAVFLAISEQFSKANINQLPDEAFASIAPVIGQARERGMRVRGYLSTVFGYDDLAFSPREVARRARWLLDMGCFEVSLGDTTAIGAPETTRVLIGELQSAGIALPQVAMHFHDTFGRAIDNVAVSYQMGIRIFDASTGGLGGCPYANSPKGNLAMEDLVSWCHAHTIACGVDTEALRKAGIYIHQQLSESKNR